MMYNNSCVNSEKARKEEVRNEVGTSMERRARSIISIALAAAVLLAIVFIFGSTYASADVKPLERGQIYRVGTCVAPGEGYGQNGGYEMTAGDKKDGIAYKGEYLNTFYSHIDKNEDPDGYKQPYYIAYINREKRYYYTGGGGGVRYEVESPGAYYDYNAKCYDLYIIPGGWYKYPMNLRIKHEDKGVPWGVQVIDGTGKKGDSYKFGVLFSQPYRIDLSADEHGTVKILPNAEAGETVTISVEADLGYVVGAVTLTREDGSMRVLTPDAEGNYSFTMPEQNVAVGVNFPQKEALATITSSDGVATGYHSVEEAIANWTDGTTLTLFEGTEFKGPIEITDSRTLDLNGYLFKTNKKAFVIKNGGSLRLIDSAPDRQTKYDGKNYTGGYLLGKVNGCVNYTENITEGLIDVYDGAFTMDGGTVENPYDRNTEKTWVLSADAGAKIRINDGRIIAYNVVIMKSRMDVSVVLAGGRYIMEALFPVEQNGGKYTSAIRLAGGYFKQSLYYAPGIAKGYRVEDYGDQKDWLWPDYDWRIGPDPENPPCVDGYDHDWGPWEVTKKETADEEGVLTRVCKKDPSHVETRTVPKSSYSNTVSIAEFTAYYLNAVETLTANFTQATQKQVNWIIAAYNAMSEKAKSVITAEELAKLQDTMTYLSEMKETVYQSLKMKKGSKALLSWKENPDADGYQLWYKAKGLAAKKVNINSSDKLKTTIKNLKAGKLYKFKIRPFTKVEDLATGDTDKVYGKWSELLKAKTKK